MPETIFTDPDLTTFLGLDALGLTAVGQHLTAKRAVIECRMPIGFEDPFCRACGAQGVSRGTVARRLAHVPVGWRPTEMVVCEASPALSADACGGRTPRLWSSPERV